MKRTRRPKKSAAVKSVQSTPADAVQNLAAASDCTETSIGKSVQPAIVKVSMQDFRAHLKLHIDGEAAVLVRKSWGFRAIVLPVRVGWRFNHESREERKGRLTRLFVAALQQIGDE